MWETPVQFLGGEDPLEEAMAAHSGILIWEIPRTEEPGGLQSMGLQKSWTSLDIYTTHTDFLIFSCAKLGANQLTFHFGY